MLKEKLEESEMSKQGQILSMKNLLKDKEKIIDTKENDITALKNDNKSLGKEINEYKEKYSKLSDKFRQADSKLSDKTTDIDKMKNTIMTLEMNNTAMKRD